MKQLTGLDATFLYMETPNTFGHVTGLMLFDRPTPDFDPFAAVHDMYASLVGRIEPMRRRLVEVPLGLDHPYWIFDPNFDLDFHIRALNIPKPGLVDQLADQVARIVGRAMDRSRPLWEVYVIEGLADGSWGLLTKYHHATIDGAAGQLMLEMILSADPHVPPPEPSPDWEPEAIPTPAELLRLTAANLARNPIKAARTQLRLVRTAAQALGVSDVSGVAATASDLLRRAAGRGADHRPRVSLPVTPAPPTPWNRTITPHRRFALRTTSLDNIKRLKQVTGGTVNDIVMAICAGGLRSYLLAHDALPDKPLRAMVPVSIRTGNESDPWTNRVSGIIADLPTNVDDPIERIARCHEAMVVAKRQMELVPAEALIDITQFSPPVLSTAAVRLASQLKLADRVNMPVNLVISNVPGPREPLYFQGAQMLHQFPVSIVTDGQGLNITVQSYMDRLGFGFIADRDLVPDVWDLADFHIAEIDRLFEASGAERAAAPEQPEPRRGAMRDVIAARQADGRARHQRSAPTTEQRTAPSPRADGVKRPAAAKKLPATKPAATKQTATKRAPTAAKKPAAGA
ncbi:WS/DGAT/MGAT family O-acyltransferase [Desertimonas flava]|uniref:WS/DGAT/MGAT family O-acyltransferase n=1 Tax=Desertimonas flava TaxID=2064846 RepID=UPI000E342048|nr:wax ester/triacylglycerol synthase family O-acyltransferase [Desertimonas flava]